MGLERGNISHISGCQQDSTFSASRPFTGQTWSAGGWTCIAITLCRRVTGPWVARGAGSSINPRPSLDPGADGIQGRGPQPSSPESLLGRPEVHQCSARSAESDSVLTLWGVDRHQNHLGAASRCDSENCQSFRTSGVGVIS